MEELRQIKVNNSTKNVNLTNEVVEVNNKTNNSDKGLIKINIGDKQAIDVDEKQDKLIVKETANNINNTSHLSHDTNNNANNQVNQDNHENDINRENVNIKIVEEKIEEADGNIKDETTNKQEISNKTPNEIINNDNYTIKEIDEDEPLITQNSEFKNKNIETIANIVEQQEAKSHLSQQNKYENEEFELNQLSIQTKTKKDNFDSKFKDVQFIMDKNKSNNNLPYTHLNENDKSSELVFNSNEICTTSIKTNNNVLLNNPKFKNILEELERPILSISNKNPSPYVNNKNNKSNNSHSKSSLAEKIKYNNSNILLTELSRPQTTNISNKIDELYGLINNNQQQIKDKKINIFNLKQSEETLFKKHLFNEYGVLSMKTAQEVKLTQNSLKTEKSHNKFSTVFSKTKYFSSKINEMDFNLSKKFNLTTKANINPNINYNFERLDSIFAEKREKSITNIKHNQLERNQQLNLKKSNTRSNIYDNSYQIARINKITIDRANNRERFKILISNLA